MNLSSLNNIVAGIKKCTAEGFFRQFFRSGVLSFRLMNYQRFRAALVSGLMLAGMLSLSPTVQSQTNYFGTNGTEYAVIGSLAGDQVYPDAAVNTSGGLLVWQDNITDGDGWGISARRLDSTLSGALGVFRVNVTGGGNQENPKVVLLKNGGGAFVWQGGVSGAQHVYARFMSASNTFLSTTDILVSTPTNNYQINPAAAVLNNSNVIVVWASYRQAGSNSMQDVYGQIFSPAGAKVGSEFLVNQFINFNQRTPSVAAQPGGGFIVVWVSEQQRVATASMGTNTTYVSASAISTPSVDIYARMFGASGNPAGNEFLVNNNFNPCATPAISITTDGSFLVAWTAHDSVILTNSWDIYARSFNSAGVGGSVITVNSRMFGDEYSPHVSAIGSEFMVLWTSLGQDGSREGVYAQFVHNDGALVGNEILVNKTTASQQMYPCIASDGVNQFFVAWSSFTGFPNQFDLFAQRYLSTSALLQPLSAPYVWNPFTVSSNVYQPQLVVSWSPVQGLAISNYEVYVNGSSVPTGLTTSNQWTMTAANGLTVNDTRSFQVDYVMMDGRRAPISISTSGTTWSGLNWGGIPYEWMAVFFGGYYNGNYNTSFWPQPTTRIAADGPTLKDIFISGGNPYDSTTWLKQSLVKTPQGLFLNWNTQPGAMYQVQSTASLAGWLNLGSPRFAAGTNDSIYVGGSPVGYYRIILLR